VRNVARSMREAAQGFLDLLRPDQRPAATYPFGTQERRRWQYTPGPRGGIRLGDLEPPQCHAAMSLLRAALSARAFATAESIIALERVLRELERAAGDPDFEGRDPGHYWVSVFGSPDREVPWAWRVGGHHLCLHVTVVGDQVASVPLFFGADPACVPEAGLRVLGAEEDQGRAFVRGLDEDQLRRALVSETAPSDILTRNTARADVTGVPTGIGQRDLTQDQRNELAALVALYTHRTATPLPVDLDALTFAWMGSTSPGHGHYYTIRAGSLLVEYDNTQNNANHVHTVVRDLTRDWGEDLLVEHYRREHDGTGHDANRHGPGKRRAPTPERPENGPSWVT
jgi:hypothetical protein